MEHEVHTTNGALPESKFNLGSNDEDVLKLIDKYLHTLGLVFFVWLLGYLQFSVAWLLIIIFVYIYVERYKIKRDLKLNTIKQTLLNEREAIIARLDEIPSWVYFPDKERCEWLNKIVKHLWPHFGQYMSLLFRTKIEPLIQQTLPIKLNFDKIDFGDIPPKITSIKVYTDNLLTNEIIIDLELIYAGDANLRAKFKQNNLQAGIKSLQFQGDLRIILKPLCNTLPFFAALTIYFLRAPLLDFDLTDAANALDIPGISQSLRATISDILSKFVVLPNRLVIPILNDFNLQVDMNYLKTPHYKGVVKCKILNGINLVGADMSLFNRKQTSDAYVKISGLSTSLYKTKTIQNSLNPIWNETFYFPIEDIDSCDSCLKFEVYDKDLKSDDFLGFCVISIKEIIDKKYIQSVYDLKEVKHGQLNLELEWSYLSTSPEYLQELMSSPIYHHSQAKAFLLVYLKNACDLPMINQSYGNSTKCEPCPYVKLSIESEEHKSSTRVDTCNPVWEENYSFLIRDPCYESLNIQILSNTNELCNLRIKLNELVKEKNLTVDRQFMLNCANTSYTPKIHLVLRLRVFQVSLLANKRDEQKQQKEDATIDTLRQRANTLNNKPLNKVDSIDLGLGKIRLTLNYKRNENLFLVIVHECRDLVRVHDDNLPDPYVRLFLRPDLKSKQTTKSIHDTLNPTYEETFKWKLHDYEEFTQKKLEISIKNNKPLLTNERVYMGQLTIDLNKLDVNTPLTGWFGIREFSDTNQNSMQRI